MASIQDLVMFFNLILAILTILLFFGIIAILPFTIFRLMDKFEYFFNRRSFIKDLTRSLQENLTENLENVESIFLINFTRGIRTEEYPFVLNKELRHFIGLINSKYKDIIGSEINFRNIPNEDLRNWRTIIEHVIIENRERLYYADLPLEDRVSFREILDYFRDNGEIENQHQIFIRTRLMEIKRIMLKKNDELKKSQYINFGALFVSIVGIILTIVFGLRLIG